MTSRDYPNNVIALFPEKLGTNPLDHPVIKEFLADVAAHTEIHSHDVDDEEVVMTWIAGDYVVVVHVNVRTRFTHIVAVDREENEVLRATPKIGPEQKNRWLGYWIDDRS